MSSGDTQTRTELDSHADTCCVGSGAAILYKSEHTIQVEGFLSSLGSVNVPIVTAAVAYDDPLTMNTFVLVIHQALYFEQLRHNLFSPNQLRQHGIIVNDTPLYFIPPGQRGENDHRIVIPEIDLSIDLKLRGVISYFETRKPTQEEIDGINAKSVEITTDSQWQPYDSRYGHDEETLRMGTKNVVSMMERGTGATNSTPEIDLHLRCVSSALTPAGLTDSILSSFPSTISSARTTKRKTAITPETLAARWRIGIETARRTLESTTQRGVRDFSEYKGTRRLKHSHYQLRYRLIRDTVYTDTMYAAVPAWRTKNKFAQVYSTSFGWVWASPIQSKGDAHHTLSQLHRRFGIPATITSDAANELVGGEFRKKCLSAGTHLEHPTKA